MIGAVANRDSATFAACARIARCAALGDVDGLVLALTSASAQSGDSELGAALHRYQLRPMVDATLAAQGEAWRARLGPPPTPRVVQQELLDAFAALRDALADAGIPTLVLKGAVLAELLYGGLSRRPQYDVDVLVRRHDARRARRILVSKGYRAGRRDGHSVTLGLGAVRVDLHHALRSSPAYAIDEERIWHRARSVDMAGTGARTLADDDTLALLTMSVVEDVGFGMAKLKNLCDIWLLVRLLDPVLDWDEWFLALAEENLESVVVNGCALALLVMVSGEDAPALARAIEHRRELVRVTNGAHAAALMTATRGSADNIAWFGEVYPGSLLGFRVHSFVFGLPATFRDLRPGRIAHQIDVHRARRAALRNATP
jgi:hypothetical protein